MIKRSEYKKAGTEKEKLAGELLKQKGYEIVAYNFSCKSGEIDIIAKEQGYLVFVEVKYRSHERNGYPEEAVNRRKRQRIVKAAQYYMMRQGYPEETPCRFDVVVFLGNKYNILKDAFEAE